MSEELLQTVPQPMGRYLYWKVGNSTLRQLKSAGIIRGQFARDITNKKPDGLITLADGHVKAVVEYKPPSELRTARQIKSAIEQELEVAKQLCKLLVVTTGTRTIWVNARNGNRVVDEDGRELSTVLDAKSLQDGSLSPEDVVDLELLLDKIDHSLSETQDQITTPKVLDPSSLAKTMWQKIWVNTGKEPEKCLYNVVELFVFKFLSDLGVLQPHHSFSAVYRLVERATPTAALIYYANNSRKEIETLFPKGDDGTTVINGTIFVNEQGRANTVQASLFAEVLRHLQEYDNRYGSLRYIDREFKTRLYESFLRQSAGIKFLGQYFTPRNVVRSMIEISDAGRLRDGARICDPFCGVGGFLLECIAMHPHIARGFVPSSGVIDPSITMVGYDKGSDEKEDERTIILAKANMLIYLSDLLGQYHSRSHLTAFSNGALNRVFTLLRTNLGTFGRVADEPYDLILTNPPYVTSGSRSLRYAIEEQELSSHYTIAGRGAETLAIEWIVRNLRENGQALVVVPDGLLNQGAVLDFLKSHCTIECIASLPMRTFYSTSRKTYILGLRKKESRNAAKQTQPVFSYLVGEIGETRDANRFPLQENDLVDMVSLFNQFKGAPDSFTSTSPRCKIVPFDEVAAAQHWMVDRWWSSEEKQGLGAAVDTEVINEADYDSALSRISSVIAEFSELRNQPQPSLVEGEVRTIYLGDTQLFEFVATKTGWTRSDLLGLNTEQESDAPVYTAAATAVAYVKTGDPRLITCSEIDPLFSFASNGDGSAGRNFVVHDTPFYVSNDRTVIRVLSEDLVLEFLHYKLQSMKEEYGFGFAYKATPSNLKDVSVDVPVLASGRFDRDSQQAIVDSHAAIDNVQKELEAIIRTLSSSRVVVG